MPSSSKEQIKPWLLDRCPVTGLDITRRPYWTDCTFGLENYRITYCRIGEDIVLAKVWGYSPIEATENHVRMIENVAGKDGGKFFLIEDYSDHAGTSFKAKTRYIECMRFHPRLRGIAFYGTSAVFNLMIRVGIRVSQPSFPVRIASDYGEAVSLAAGGRRVRPDRPGEKPARVSNPGWTMRNPHYSTVLETLGDDIIYNSSSGRFKEEDVAPFGELYRKVAAALPMPAGCHYRIMDWTGLKSSTWKARTVYLETMKGIARDFPVRLTVLYGANRMMNLVLRISARFAPTRELVMASGFDEAMRLIETDKSRAQEKAGAAPVPPAPDDTVSRLLGYMGGIQWDQPGIGAEAGAVDDKDPLKPVYEALHFIKQDFDEILSRMRSAEEKERELQEKLRQADKMQAIGQLAGGIAHDFNNQLAGILGNAELLKQKIGADAEMKARIDSIVDSVNRSADLISQLLAFARKGKYQTVSVGLHAVLREVEEFLKHSIDKRITITLALNAENDRVLGDPVQLQNAFLNLALNARDAMAERGGKLTFSTKTEELDEAACTAHPFEMAPGGYLIVKVLDTGTGMAPEVQKHIFEPFFTTKPLGKGTGMGLPAVYGTVKNHRGFIEVSSSPGRGSVFTVGLPLLKEAAPRSSDRPGEAMVRGTGRILLAEDEPRIRSIVRETLERLGYAVTECMNGAEAVENYRKAWKETDLVILDVMMPVMDGRTAFQEMRGINPGVRVVVTSGYSMDGEVREILDMGACGFIQKPFRSAELSSVVASALSKNSGGRNEKT